MGLSIRAGITTVTLILLIVQLGSFQQARAQTVDITINHDSVSIQMNLILNENLTSLPLVNTQIGPSNSTSVSQPINTTISNAIDKIVPTARLTGLGLHVRTSNSSGMWLLEEDYSLEITGVNTNSGSRIQSDLAFIAMNASQPFQIGPLELNAIGPAIILSPLEQLSTLSNIVYYIDGSNPSTSFIPITTTRFFSLLDFSWVNTVATWNNTSNILGQNTSWSLIPTNPRYNLTLGLKSPEGPFLKTYIAIYNPTLSITLPENGYADGNTISFDIPNINEMVMPIIVIASLIILTSAFIIDRRLSGAIRSRKKKR